MPADPVLVHNDVIEHTITAKTVQENAMVLNRQYYRLYQEPATPTDKLSDARSALFTHWQTEIMPILSADYQTVSSTAKRVSGVVVVAGVPTLQYNAAVQAPVNPVGGVAGVVFPNMITMSLWLRTGFMGRYWRGGVRLGTVPRAYQDATAQNMNKIVPATWTTLQAACVSWRNDVLSAGNNIYRLVVMSPTYWVDQLAGLGTAVDATADVSGVLLSDYFRTQRTRNAPHVP